MNKDILVIDSSVFVSAFHDVEAFHQESTGFFTSLQTAKPQVFLPSLVLAETIITLHKHKIEHVESVLELLFSLHIIPLDLTFLQKTLPYASKTKLKTSDFLIAAAAKLYKATLITWDKQLLSDTSLGITIQTPKQYIHS